MTDDINYVWADSFHNIDTDDIFILVSSQVLA